MKQSRLRRVSQGLALIAVFALGLWWLKPMIIRDMPRMFPWQQVLFWVGELGALLVVLRWTVHAGGCVAAGQFSSGRGVALILVLSLLVDVGATSASMVSSYLGMQRAVAAQAEVMRVSESFYHAAKHVRFDILFATRNGTNVATQLSLVDGPGQPREAWKVLPLRLAAAKAANNTLQVMYDPSLPSRVWFQDQTWGSTSDLSTMFVVIHIFQMIVVCSISGDLLSKRTAQVDESSIQLLPLWIEAAGLCVLGYFLHQP